MLSGNNYICFIPFITKKGDLIYVESKFSTGKWDGKNMVFVVSKDISVLKHSEQKFNKIFVNSPIPIAFQEKLTSVFVDVNEAFLKLIETQKENVIGKTPLSLNLFPDLDIRQKAFSLLKEKGYFNDIEVKIKTMSGKIIIGLFTGTFVKVLDKEYILTMMTDITDIKKYNDEMQEMIKTKDKLFSIIAHDLRTPFQSILGFSEFITADLKKNNFSDISKYSEMINSSSRQYLYLLDNLLDWVRTQTGKLDVVPETININEEINNILLLYKTAINAKSINVHLKVNKKYVIEADRNMFATVIRNLINNSVKFLQKGGKLKLSVSLLKKSFKFTFSDNGIGIPEDVQKNLFIFNRQKISKGTHGERGTGLGLILCKEFIEKHKGSIKIQSEVGNGTSVCFTIPFLK